ncbi:type II secretion system protein [Halarchaeum grantii]|uniref:Type II secretion system protein n=1 Tax=Halarchaeum grantii TaxID=1193105 RepID=A0A830F242_9EURY|nr:type II/IV secretion system ATPase subunit [Halarchaeum grantii]GGL33245.1 type II secretion system protein [Halarchaeum grantii]
MTGDTRERVREALATHLDARDPAPFDALPDVEALVERFDVAADPDPAVDAYWVTEPYAHVALRRDPDTEELRYDVLEPTRSEFADYVYEDLRDVARRVLLDEEYAHDESGREAFADRLDDVLAEHARGVPPAERWVVRYYLRRDFLGYGRIDPFMSDPAVEDVSCDGADVPLYAYHRDHGHLQSNRSWGSDVVESIAVRLAQRAGRHVSAANPLLTTTLPDGSRVQVTLGGDVATRGSNFTVRKFREEPFTPPELASLGTFDARQLAYLWLAVAHNRSVLFVGPTGSGKTTSMNACAFFVPPDHKVVSIEETREVNLPHENWVADVTRTADDASADARREVDGYRLLSEALHQRPDHIVVGELRTDPAVVRAFFQAVGTGHDGFTTFHAETADDAIRRLTHDPLSVPPDLLADLDVVVVQRIVDEPDGVARRCWQIAEVGTPDGDERPSIRDVFRYDADTQGFEQRAPARVPREIAADRGWRDDRLREALDSRQRVLAHLAAEGSFDYEAVADRVFTFERNPERVLADLPEGVREGAERVRIADD